MPQCWKPPSKGKGKGVKDDGKGKGKGWAKGEKGGWSNQSWKGDKSKGDRDGRRGPRLFPTPGPKALTSTRMDLAILALFVALLPVHFFVVVTH